MLEINWLVFLIKNDLGEEAGRDITKHKLEQWHI